ncbi:hypothetical protein ACFX2I_043092 [Malus domestica]
MAGRLFNGLLLTQAPKNQIAKKSHGFSTMEVRLYTGDDSAGGNIAQSLRVESLFGVGTLITRPSAPGGIDNPMENLAVRVAGLGCSKLLLESSWKGDQDHFSIETDGRSPRRDCILTF